MKTSFVRPVQLPQGLSILFQIAKQSTEMNLKLLKSYVIVVMSQDRQVVALTLLLLLLDQLGRLFANFYQYSQTKVYLL